MKNLRSWFLALAVSMIATSLYAQSDLTVVAVGQAELERDGIGFVQAGDAAGSSEFMNVIRADFSYYKKRFLVSDKTSPAASQFDAWRSAGVKYVAEINFSGNSYNYKLYNADQRQQMGSGGGVMDSNVRTSAHQAADEIYQSITRKKSIFTSRIAFVSDRTGTRANPKKELYIMDYDGGNKRQLTSWGGTVISPAISADGQRILYSLIKEEKKRNINLYLYDLRTGENTMLSNRAGMNSGAVFMPDENEILMTLSHTGNAELYVMNLNTKALRRVTNHYASDVDPSISADGSLMAFLTDRPGKAEVYTGDPSGTEKGMKRISYVGKFNATPRFSPDGKEIVFASWLDERFDLFRIGADGKGLGRLTKDFGSNEDPSYSSDGEFIAFTSQRVISQSKADQRIYIMDRDGGIIGSITDNYGNCQSPRWSK